LKNKKKLFNAALATAMAAGAVVAVAPTATEAATTTFKDVDSSNSHYNTINNLVERGYVKGYEDQTFKPGQAVTRAHAALILANVLGLDTKNVTDPKFKDVPKSHPYYGAIAALANAGYIKGFTDGTYGMNKTLTRGQMAVILTHAFELKAGTKTLPFKDVPNNHEYKEYISALYSNNVTAGTTATTFSPAASVTRGQFATFVVKGEIAAPEKVVSVKDGQLTTNKGTYAIEGELAKVFNASNAAALKGAKVTFKFADQTAAVASTNTVAATETTTKKIIGLASLTLVAGNVTFNADGYLIPELNVNANNVEVKNAVIEKLDVAANVTVKLSGVELKALELSTNSKVILDTTSKIEKLVLPKGADIKDFIENYDQVKDAITTIVVVDGNGTETPYTPGQPTPGGGGGGGSTPSPAIESAIDAAIENLVTSDNNSKISQFGEISFSSSSNVITFDIKSNAKTTTIADVRTALKTLSAGVSYINLIDGLSNQQIDDLLTVTSVTITAGTKSQEFKRSDYFDYVTKDIKRDVLVPAVDTFVDQAITASGKTVTNLDQFGQAFDNKITINVSGVNYTVDINGYTNN